MSRPLCQSSPSSPKAELLGVPQLCTLPFPFRPKEGSKNEGACSKRALEEEEGNTDVLSKNKQKKQLRNPHKTFDPSLKRKPFLLLSPQRGPPQMAFNKLQGRLEGRTPRPSHTSWRGPRGRCREGHEPVRTGHRELGRLLASCGRWQWWGHAC